MKKPLKIAIIILAVLLIFIAAASLFVKSYMTEERMRALVIEIAEKSLNRKAVLGEIKVSLFRGIVVKDFEIREKDAEKVFFKTKEFVLKYQFLPLFAKKLVIDKLSIEDVQVSVKTNPDGAYNFSDMAKPEKIEDRKEERDKAASLPVSLNVKTVTIKNAKLSYIDIAGKLKKADVIINAELGITGLSQNTLSSEGSFRSTITEALLRDGNKIFKDIKTDVRYKISLDMDAKQIAVHSVDANIVDIPVHVEGTVNYASGTAYSLAVKVPDCNLSKIRKDVISMFLPEAMVLGGSVSMLLNVNKKNDKERLLGVNGNVKMTKVSCTYKGTHLVLDGSVALTPEMMTLEGLKLIAGQNSADVSGTVRNYQEYPDLNVSIKSKSIDLDGFLVPAASSVKAQETAKGNEQEKKQSSAEGDDVKREMEPMNLKLKVTASLDIDKTRYKGISITNFRSRYELKNNVLTIPYLNGNTLSGAFALKGALDLTQRGTRYRITSDLNGVKIEEMIDAFAPKAKGKIFGILSGKTEITGAGTLPVNVKRNLKGKGAFAIKDGALRNAELSAGLLAILGLQDLREIPIEKANGRFTISDGTVNLATLIGSKDMIIDETGTVGLDEKLDLAILVKVSDRLAPKLVSQSSIASFLSGEKGWTSLPLGVGGTISKSSYGIDSKAVGKKVREGVQKKIGEELLKILPKSQGTPSGTQQKKGASPEDLIKGIFGK